MAAVPEALTEPVDARDQDWAALIERMAGGDESALSSLYDRSSRLIFGLLLRILNDAGLAEEVMLDVYMQVWRQAGKYDRSRGKTLAWVVTIARSRAIDRLRSNVSRERVVQRSVEGTPLVDENAALDAAIRSEKSQLVRSALAQIPEEQRRALMLAYLDGLTQTEIAAHLDQPLGTVKTRMRSGLRKLNELLRKGLEGYTRNFSSDGAESG